MKTKIIVLAAVVGLSVGSILHPTPKPVVASPAPVVSPMDWDWGGGAGDGGYNWGDSGGYSYFGW